MISHVPPEALDFAWNALLPQIEKALSHGAGDSTTTEHVYNALKSGQFGMLVVHEGEDITAGVIISEKVHPNKKTLFVEIAAGRDLDSWIKEIEEVLLNWKQHIGADTIEACARRGLAKKLGWETKAILLELK